MSDTDPAGRLPADTHSYELSVRWTGDRGAGTAGYRAYGREHEVTAPGKPTIPGTADPAFRGDPERWSPEDLLVAAVAQCHQLWFLHLAADAGVIVTGYTDDPIGTMAMNPDGSGQFTQVLLRPRVTVAGPGMIEPAQSLHGRVGALCFIARSVNFPVLHEPVTVC
jgi:organic hydroperoxide reductase OsmC/OhrA